MRRRAAQWDRLVEHQCCMEFMELCCCPKILKVTRRHQAAQRARPGQYLAMACMTSAGAHSQLGNIAGEDGAQKKNYMGETFSVRKCVPTLYQLDCLKSAATRQTSFRVSATNRSLQLLLGRMGEGNVLVAEFPAIPGNGRQPQCPMPPEFAPPVPEPLDCLRPGHVAISSSGPQGRNGKCGCEQFRWTHRLNVQKRSTCFPASAQAKGISYHHPQ